MNTVRSTIFSLVALSACGAQAAEWDAPRQMAVSYAGLDLKTTAGAKILYRRIEAAADSVCSDFYGKDLMRQRRWKECRDQAIARAVIDVNAPTLMSYYASKGGKAKDAVALAAER